MCATSVLFPLLLLAFAGSFAINQALRPGVPVWSKVTWGAGFLVLAALIFANLGILGTFLTPSKEPQVFLPSTGISYGSTVHPCSGKEQCVSVYLSPNCPACHASREFITALGAYLQSDSRIGLRIVVGKGSEDEVRRMAYSFSGNIFMDPDGRLFEAMGLRGYPYWWVSDRDGNITTVRGGSPQSTDPQTLKWFVQSHLDLMMH